MAEQEASTVNTAHNWALVARHLDIRSCLALMGTCRDLYHNLASQLPLWHFQDQFNDWPVFDAAFATATYKDNEAFLIERSLVYARLGLWVPVGLPLLERMREDPRMHSTVRVVVGNSQDIKEVIAPIISTGSRSDAPAVRNGSDSGAWLALNDNDPENDGQISAAKRSNTGESTKSTQHPVARGPAAVSWTVSIKNDNEAQQLNRRLTAVARVTTVDKLCVRVEDAIFRLTLTDVQELTLHFVSNGRICRLETTGVHTIIVKGTVRQEELEGKCKGLDSVRVESCGYLTQMPALNGARSVNLKWGSRVTHLSAFENAHKVLLSWVEGNVDLRSLTSVRHLCIAVAPTLTGGTIELPSVEELEMIYVGFASPAEVRCPQATRVTLLRPGQLHKIVPAKRLQRLRATADELQYVEADKVQDLRVELRAKQDRSSGGLSADTLRACDTIEAWRQEKAVKTLTVAVEAELFSCEVVLRDPPSVIEAVRGFLRVIADRTVHPEIQGGRQRSAAAVDGAQHAHGTGRLQPEIFPRCVQQLCLKLVDVDGWVLEGVKEVMLLDCVGRVTVRGAKQIQVQHSPGYPLRLAVEECGELRVSGEGKITLTVSRVRMCRISGHDYGEHRIERIEGVHRLHLERCRLINTTVEDMARYGCDVLRADFLRLPKQSWIVGSTFMYGRTVEQREEAMQRQLIVIVKRR